MPRYAWLLNLAAELELGGPNFQAPAKLLEQLREFGGGAQRLLGSADRLIVPGQTCVPEQEPGWLGRAWCPTPLAIAALHAAGVTPEPHPSFEVVRRVNHRRFAVEVGGGLSLARYCETRGELEAHLDYTAGPWLLKRSLAFAGRGQLRVFGGLTQVQSAWVAATLQNDGLVVEPLITPLLEVSLHGFLWRDGRFELGLPCVQQVTERGVFRGVRRADAGELSLDEQRALLESGQRVGSALGTAGYFGPFGIDAHRYDSPSGRGFCALSEINARYSMGFATGFPRPATDLSL